MISLAAILDFPKVKIEKIHPSKIEKGVLKVLRKIRPDWPREDIILQRFSEAFSNILYGGYTTDKNDMILVKIYGDENSDKTNEIEAMRLFASRRFASQIFATFANGYACEYLPGIAMNYELCIDHDVYPLVASRIGDMHREMRDQVLPRPSAKRGHVFDMLKQWVEQIPAVFRDEEVRARIKKEMPSKFALERELKELDDILNRPHDLHNPILYCHGDLNPSNIIYDPIRNTVAFVDLEFVGPNFQAFEIAQHFMTFACGDMSKVGRNEFVPAREFQLRWCHVYLSAFRGKPSQLIPSYEIENLWLMVQKFSLVFCLQEIIWALNRVDDSNIPGFDILQYGILRYQQYHRNKYHILAMDSKLT